MKLKLKFTLIFFTCMGYAIYSQNDKKKLQSFSQKDVFASRMLHDNYDIWSYKNVIVPKNDTTTYYVDVTNYKGIINYGVDFSAKDKKVVNFNEDFNLFYLEIKFNKCSFSINDSVMNIEGEIKGGWDFWDLKGKFKDKAEIAVGELQNHSYILNFSPEYFSPEI